MIYEGQQRKGIDVAEGLRLMIKQIAGPIQILSGSVGVALRARRAVVSSITWRGGFCTQQQYSGPYRYSPLQFQNVFC